MKKIIAIVLLAALVAGAAFAEVTGYGRVRTNVGLNLNLWEDNDKDTDEPPYPPAWIFAPTARLGLKGSIDVVDFFVQADLNDRNTLGTIRANATVKFGDAALSIGQNELPWYQPSSLAFLGDSNNDFGASNTVVIPYVRFNAFGAYLGITSGNKVNAATTDKYIIPGFFLGYDLKQDNFSVGVAFAGLTDAGDDPDDKDDDIFSWMGNIHAKFNLAPLTLGLNVSLYGDPSTGYFSLYNGTAGVPYGITNPKDSMVLEAMLDAAVKLSPCTIGFTGAVLMNLKDADENDAEKDGGAMALRLSLNATFDLGGNFRLIPGVIYTGYLSGPQGVKIEDNKGSDIKAGITFLYSF